MRTTRQKHKAKAKTQETRAARRAERKSCPVRGTYCGEHGFVHGAEAEELRAGVEKLMADESERTRDGGYAVNVVDLQRLLDSVDARDSLAFVETKPRRGRRTDSDQDTEKKR